MEILSHLVVAKGSTCNNSFIWRGYSHCPQTIGFSGMSLSDRLPNLYGVYLPCSGMCVCVLLIDTVYLSALFCFQGLISMMSSVQLTRMESMGC